MGINTPEGKAAWNIAYWAGDHIRRVIDSNEDTQKKVMIHKVNPIDLEGHLQVAIIHGLQLTLGMVLIENQERLRTKAMQWLSKEVNDRFSQGLEFNLLDSVSVRKGEDGFIYLKYDKREPYSL